MGDECVWLLRLGDDFQIRSMLNRGHSKAVYKCKHSLTGSATFFLAILGMLQQARKRGRAVSNTSLSIETCRI